MQENGLRSCVLKKFKVTTTDSNHTHPIAPNVLNQQFRTTAKAAHGLGKLDFFKVGQKDFDATEARGICNENTVLIYLTGVVDFT
ncbi:hypothetical protein [Cohnella hongkongensis]|uniref:Uncharacterized protein n=1 Tax=Cohnella hongkongensis TaxID=178337 RepID=A0ABV9FEN4_9BACL